MSNFDKIVDFHKAFGLLYNKDHEQSTLDNEALVKLRIGLIEEELCELKDAIKESDYTEVRDAIADLLYVTYGTAASFGINADKDFDVIHRSNMTKLCKTEDEAKDTVKWYKENNKGGIIAGTYIHGIFENDSWRNKYINLIRKSKNLPLLNKKSISYKKKRDSIINSLANEFDKHLNLTQFLN